MQESQRTERVTWATRRSRNSPPSVTTAPSAFCSSGCDGSAGASWSRCSPTQVPSAFSAGSMKRVWNAPATGQRAHPGALGRVLDERVDGVLAAGGDHLAGPVAVGRLEVELGETGEHGVGVTAEDGGHRRRLLGARGGHLPPAHGREGDGLLGVDDPGDRRGGQLADGVPGHHRVVGDGHLEPELVRRRAARTPRAAAGSRRCPRSRRRPPRHRGARGRGRPRRRTPGAVHGPRGGRATGRACRASGRPDRGRGSRSRSHLITTPRRAEGVGATNSRPPWLWSSHNAPDHTPPTRGGVDHIDAGQGLIPVMLRSATDPGRVRAAAPARRAPRRGDGP